MGFVRVEEVTLPARFLLKTAHFVAVLTLVLDIDNVVSGMTNVIPRTASGSALDSFNSTKTKVQGLTYAAFGCFGIEFISQFMGVTTFMPGLNLLNIVLHGAGLILIVLLYVDNWSVKALIAFFTVFNALPTSLELFVLFFSSTFSFLKY